MKRLRTILQHNFIYYLLLVIVLVSYFINSNLDYVSVYDSFNEEEFIISNIIEKDYGLKLELKGKEKVLGFLYLDEKSEINNFLGEYTLGDKVLVGDEETVVNPLASILTLLTTSASEIKSKNEAVYTMNLFVTKLYFNFKLKGNTLNCSIEGEEEVNYYYNDELTKKYYTNIIEVKKWWEEYSSTNK